MCRYDLNRYRVSLEGKVLIFSARLARPEACKQKKKAGPNTLQPNQMCVVFILRGWQFLSQPQKTMTAGFLSSSTFFLWFCTHLPKWPSKDTIAIKTPGGRPSPKSNPNGFHSTQGRFFERSNKGMDGNMETLWNYYICMQQIWSQFCNWWARATAHPGVHLHFTIHRYGFKVSFERSIIQSKFGIVNVVGIKVWDWIWILSRWVTVVGFQFVPLLQDCTFVMLSPATKVFLLWFVAVRMKKVSRYSRHQWTATDSKPAVQKMSKWQVLTMLSLC